MKNSFKQFYAWLSNFMDVLIESRKNAIMAKYKNHRYWF